MAWRITVTISAHSALSVQQYSWRIDENLIVQLSILPLLQRYQTQVGPGGNANFNNIAHVLLNSMSPSYYHTFSPTTFLTSSLDM